MSVINAACRTAMPTSERGAPAAYWKDQTRGKNSLKGTRAAPTINQFKDTRAQSAPIDRSHLDAMGLCKGRGFNAASRLSGCATSPNAGGNSACRPDACTDLGPFLRMLMNRRIFARDQTCPFDMGFLFCPI